MKKFGTILKILAALAAIAGAIYVLATYGDKIVAWAKSVLAKVNCCCCKDAIVLTSDEEVAPAEEVAAEEATAEETDFEG